MPPKSIKGKERLSIQPPKPKPKPRARMPIVEQIEAPEAVPQFEAPPQYPRLPAPPKPKSAPLVIRGKDRATLRGSVNSVLKRYYDVLKISDTNFVKYRKAIHMIFDEYTNNPRYSTLTNYH